MDMNRLPPSAKTEQDEAEDFEMFRTSLSGGTQAVPANVSFEDAELMRRLSRATSGTLSASARSRIWQNALRQSQPRQLSRMPMAGLVAAAVFVLCALAIVVTWPSAPAQLTQIETGLPFDELPVITPSNLDQLVEVAALGDGAIYAIHWLNETTLAAISARGILLLDSADLFATAEQISVGWRDVPASYHLSADGHWLAAITNAGVSIYDLTTGELSASIDAEGNRITAININQPLDDTYPRYVTVASVPESGTVTPRIIERYALGTEGEFLDVQRIELTFNMTGPFEVTGLALSPDAQHIMAYLSSGDLVRLVVSTGTRMWTQNVLMPSVTPGRTRIVVSPDGSKTALLTYNGITLLDAVTGEVVHTLNLFDAHVDPQQVTSMRFAPAGDTLLISTTSSGIIQYDWVTETMERFPINHTAQDFAISPDQTFIASLEDNSTVSLWDFSMMTLLNSVRLGSMPVNALEIGETGVITTSFSGDGTIRFADIATGQIREIAVETTFINDIAFSPDGSVLAASLQEFNQFRVPTRTGELGLIDMATDEVMLLNSGDGDTSFSGVAYDAEGTLYALNSRSLQAWERGDLTGTVLVASVRDIPFTRLAVSADGRWAAWSSDNGEVLIVDLDTQDSFVYAMPRYESVPSLEFIPDSHLLAVSVFSGSVHIIDPETTTLMALFELSNVVFGGAVISPDASLLAVQTSDRQLTTGVSFWDLAAGEEVNSSIPEHVDIRAAQFSADGRLLITGGADGIVRVWGAAE